MSQRQQRAVLSNVRERTLIYRPIPALEDIPPKQVLIKIVAAASNPKDFKSPIWRPIPQVEGSDVAGFIEAVGSEVTTLKKGDRVASFIRQRSGSDYGAYQEYTLADAHTTFKIGPQTSIVDASTVPLAGMTAALSLFAILKLPEKGSGQTIIVNSGASTVAHFAIQLLHDAGYKVVTTAGNSHEAVKKLGVEKIVDYRGKSDDELANALYDAAPSARHALDCVSSESSVAMLSKALKKGGEICWLLPGLDKVPLANGVTGQQESVEWAWNREELVPFATRWYEQIGQWLDSGKLKPMRVKLMPDGLDSVDDALKLLEDNKVNNEKLVLQIADTKFPPATKS